MASLLLHAQSTPARVTRAVVGKTAIAVGFVLYFLCVFSMSPPSYEKDFGQDYLMVRAIAEGTDPYLPLRALAERYLGGDPGSLMQLPTPHPPTLGVLLLPLAFLDYAPATMIWLGIQSLCLIGSVHLLARLAGLPLSRWRTFVVALTAICWYPVFENLYTGQLMLVLLFLLTAATLALRRGRSALAGALIGVTLLLKPVLWPLLLVFAIHRRWRTLGGALAVTSLGFGIATPIIGPERMFAYFAEVLPTNTVAFQSTSRNLSLWTIGWRFFSGTQSPLSSITAPPLVESLFAARIVSVVVPVLVLVLACWWVRRSRDLHTSLDLMIVLSILIGPTSWPSYLVLAAGPCVQILGNIAKGDLVPRKSGRVCLVAALMLVPPQPIWAAIAFLLAGQPLPYVLAGQLPFAPTLLTLVPALATTALAALILVERRRDDEARPLPRPIVLPTRRRDPDATPR